MLSCRVPQLKKHVYYLYDHYHHRPITNKFTKMGIKASSLELKSLSLSLLLGEIFYGVNLHMKFFTTCASPLATAAGPPPPYCWT